MKRQHSTFYRRSISKVVCVPLVWGHSYRRRREADQIFGAQMLIMTQSTLKQLDLSWKPNGLVAYEVMSCDLSDPSSDYHSVCVPAFFYYSQLWCARAIMTNGPDGTDPALRQEDATSTYSMCSIVFRTMCGFHSPKAKDLCFFHHVHVVLRLLEDAVHGHAPVDTFIELVEPRVYEPLFSTFTRLHWEVPDTGGHDSTVNVLSLSWSPSSWPCARVVWSERVADLSEV